MSESNGFFSPINQAYKFGEEDQLVIKVNINARRNGITKTARDKNFTLLICDARSGAQLHGDDTMCQVNILNCENLSED